MSDSIQVTVFDDAGRYPPVPARTCTRCGHVLVDTDELGPYYQVPVSMNFPDDLALPEGTTLTYMDRVHECDGKPHSLPGRSDA